MEAWVRKEEMQSIVCVCVLHVCLTRFSQEDPDFFVDLKKDILTECEKIGPVESVNIFEVSLDFHVFL